MKTSYQKPWECENPFVSLSFLSQKASASTKLTAVAATCLARPGHEESWIAWYAGLRLCLWLPLWLRQEVDRYAMFDRQIDLDHEGLSHRSPQKFINTWPRSTALKMTFRWLEVGFGQRAQPRCTPLSDAYDLAAKSVAPLGERILPRNCSLPNRTLGRLCCQWR